MDEIIDAIIAKTEKSLSSLESTMYRSVLDHYIDNFQVDASGKIAFNDNSIAAISKLDSVLKKLDSKLADFTKTTLAGVNTIVDKSAKNLEKYNTENLDFKTANKERILKHASANVSANANLSKPLSDLKQRTIQLLSKPGGVSLSELRDMLKKESLDKGVASRQFSKWTQDLFYQYERASSNAMRKTLGFRFAIYQGGLIETSRPFCSSKNGKVFHEDEIMAWAKEDFSGKTDPYDPLTDLGGHRCRHRLGWVSDEVAFALRPELEAKYGKKAEPKIEGDEDFDKAIKSFEDFANKKGKYVEEAINIYTSNSAFKINGNLRGLEGNIYNLSNKEKNSISELSNILNESPKYLGKSFRGLRFSSAAIKNEFLNSIKKGGIYSDKGFMSASANRSVATQDFANNNGILLEIISNKGVAIALKSLVSGEEEVLHNYGQSYNIIDIKVENDLTVITLKHIDK